MDHAWRKPASVMLELCFQMLGGVVYDAEP